MGIKIGDEVVWTPNPEEKYAEVVKGYVADTVSSANGDVGFEVQILDEYGPKLVRLWASRGVFVTTGFQAAWAKTEEKKPEKPPEEPILPYRSAGDLAADYKNKGMTRQEAWDQFIKDTILQRVCRSDQVDAKPFLAAFDRV